MRHGSLTLAILAGLILLHSLLQFGSAALGGSGTRSDVDFMTAIRPILAENCLDCHGADAQQRKGDLRLDRPEAALRERSIIVPGKPDASLLIKRIEAAHDEERMPPARTGRRLTAEQVGRLRRWIEQGGNWQEHWAYVTPRKPAVPDLAEVANPIDAFIGQRLARESLAFSPEADRATLLRRLYLDLTGLPPTRAQAEEFLQDASPAAYERLVDRLLASPHYGERMAQQWLDLARYGDSDGYHDDTPRVMYQYRDYVIWSFNRNKPFDRFTIENLAGDLLPEATLEQKIGSAFHRLGPTSSEGGADAREYLAKYAVDRVNTTAAVWLGVTLHCAECHDHKYDPFTTKEYYQLFAFFNQVPEDALYRGNDAPPVIPTPTPEQQVRLRELELQISSLNAAISRQLDAPDPELEKAEAQWVQQLAVGDAEALKLSPWSAIGPFPARDGQLPPFEYAYPPEKSVDLEAAYEEGKLKWAEQPGYVDGKAHYFRGENCATYLYRTITVPHEQALTLYLGSDDGIKVWLNDRLVHSKIMVRPVAPNQDKVAVVLQPGVNRLLLKIVNLQGGYGFYFSTREKATDAQLEEARKIAALPPEERTEAQRTLLRRVFRDRQAPAIGKLKIELARASQEKGVLEQSIPRLRIMADAPQRRPTHVLVRGDFRKLGEEVQPNVPSSLPRLASPAGRAPNRLDLAQWLVSPEHPLTSRVAVNRIWQLFFGQGLVRTPEDLGVRGEPPTHPELLDWLSCEFSSPSTGEPWDVKRLVKLIVTSRTYRQSSKVSPSLLERDPSNLLLARGPRYRLPAEMIRDNALAISGLLDRARIGGPSVKPYQPGDLWREMAYGDSADKAYLQDHGPDLYRRGIYTFWKRSIHYPAFAIFDAPNREVCVARRATTNTPLHAFVTMNDVAYVEAARVFAQRILAEPGATLEDRLQRAFQDALMRQPTPREVEALRQMHARLLAKYQNDVPAARALAASGEYPRPETLDAAEHAAWTALCQVLLNLDETLTRE